MKTLLDLTFAIDILDVKEYVNNSVKEGSRLDKDLLFEYFEDLGLVITRFENFEEIIEKLIDILK